MSRIDTRISNSQIAAKDAASQWRPLEGQFEAKRRLSGAMQRPDINEWWAQLTDVQRFGYTALAFGGSVGIVFGLVTLSHSGTTDHNHNGDSGDSNIGGHGQRFPITPEVIKASLSAAAVLLVTGGDTHHPNTDLTVRGVNKNAVDKISCPLPFGFSEVTNTCIKSGVAVLIDPKHSAYDQIKANWPVVKDVLPAGAEGDKGMRVMLATTQNGDQFLLTTRPVSDKDGKAYSMVEAWATPINEDPAWAAGASVDGKQQLWLKIPLSQAAFDAAFSEGRLKVPPGLKENDLLLPVIGKDPNGIWIVDLKRTAKIVSPGGTTKQIAKDAPLTELAYRLGNVRAVIEAPATPTEAPTLEPTPALPGQEYYYVNWVKFVRQLDANGEYIWTDGTNSMVWESVLGRPVIRSVSTDGSMVFMADGGLGGWYVDVKGVERTQVLKLLQDWKASYKLKEVDGVDINNIKGVEIVFGDSDDGGCAGGVLMGGDFMCVFPPRVDENGVLHLRYHEGDFMWGTHELTSDYRSRVAEDKVATVFSATGAYLSKGNSLTPHDRLSIGNYGRGGRLSVTIKRMGEGK